jgi:hypothetical protein
METWIIENVVVIRLSFFIGIFILVAIWELLAPRRPLIFSKPVRWYSNIGIVFFNSLVMRWTFPVLAVIIFEVLLNLTAMFNHGNIYIPKKIDQILRCFVVTPDMHRVHHSIVPSETNTNFGFNFPWWDIIFRTYCAQPEKGHDGMVIGVNQFRDPKELHLHKLLIQPFFGSTRDYPINK